MPEIDVLFTTVEEYDSMTIEQLQVLYYPTTILSFSFCLILSQILNHIY